MRRSLLILFAVLLIAACATRVRPVSNAASPLVSQDRKPAPVHANVTFEFDTMGADFHPWVKSFFRQIKRNWSIPNEALVLRGHVVLTFNVQKDGTITDVAVATPSQVEAFDKAALDALRKTKTKSLPKKYPADKAFFTATFYYNESPPQEQQVK